MSVDEEPIERFDQLSPELQRRYINELPTARGPEDGRNLWRSVASEQRKSLVEQNAGLTNELEEVKGRCERLQKEVDRLNALLAEKDVQILELQERGGQRLTPTEEKIVPTKEPLPMVPTIKGEPPLTRRAETFLNRLLGKESFSAKEIARSRLAKMSGLKEEEKLPKKPIWWKKPVRLITPFLVLLVQLSAGSGAPTIPRPAEEEKETGVSHFRNGLVLYHSRSSQPPWSLRFPPSLPAILVPEEGTAQAKPPPLEVVITRGSWFWRSAKPEVAKWLDKNGYTNWVNPENGVSLSDVIINILVKDCSREKGINLQRVSAGQKFTFELEKNEEVVKAARSGSYEQYCQQQAKR